MALWDQIHTIVSEGDDPVEMTEAIMDAIEAHNLYEAAQEAADRRWNEGRY